MSRYRPRHRESSVVPVVLLITLGPIGVVWVVALLFMSIRWMITGQFT
jgi:hypothetical protein